MWQLPIILLVAIFAGIIVGILIVYVLFRLFSRSGLSLLAVCRILFGKRSGYTDSKRIAPKHRSVVIQPPSIERKPEVSILAVNDGKITSDIQPRGREDILRLLEECEQNRKTVRGFSGDNLVPLKTDAWDSNRRLLNHLEPNFRNNLESVYSDIFLLNNLVWLATEFHRSGPGMQAQYKLLSESIAKRLDTILTAPLSYSTAEKIK
jgi:hypothetical protein